MPKKPKVQTLVCNYVLSVFKDRYEERVANKITRGKSEYVKYPTMESIVEMVFESEKFHESNGVKEADLGQIGVSRGTVRKAVKKLVDENRISITNGSYELTCHMTEALNQHPILDIAHQIEVSIGVPEDMLILSVAPEYSASIARYLAALFYRRDVIFVPIGSTIFCISVFSERALGNQNKQRERGSTRLRRRIELALHKFKYSYPQFAYGDDYEFAYHISHNPSVIAMLGEEGKDIEKARPYRSSESVFRNVQEAVNFFAENPNDDEPLKMDPETGLEFSELGEPGEYEWALMDSQTMQEVDDDFKDY